MFTINLEDGREAPSKASNIKIQIQCKSEREPNVEPSDCFQGAIYHRADSDQD